MHKRIIIPARFASSRLPGKILKDIHGKTMLEHVYNKALACNFDSVIIATDNQKIYALAKSLNAEVYMTSKDHETGTDRIAEIVNRLGYDDTDIIVNIQGDEPMIPVANVLQLANNLAERPEAAMGTLCEPLNDMQRIFDPNCVKVVLDKDNYALYFSRASIPWARHAFPSEIPENFNGYRHIGLYAYRADFLRHYEKLAQAPIETCEALEQLRVLWHGYKIHVDQAKEITPQDVNTEEDLEKVRALMQP